MMQPLSANQASAIVANCPFPVVVVDSNGAASGYNGAFERLLTWLRQCGEHAATAPPFGDDPLQALTKARGTVSWSGPGGERRHFSVSSFVLPGHDNSQARIFVEISEQVRLQQAHGLRDEKLGRDTLTDAATGLLNERGLMLALEPQVARSRRYARPMAVIRLEVDYHSGQCATLTDVARLLKDQLRWADLIGCTERREFILVLPETTAEAALSLADKLAQQLAGLAPGAGNNGFCFGVAGWRKSDSANTLLKRAAQALTQARAERKLHFAAS
jgi:diguanylate cyclase (GGDEF)-like protein